MGLDDFKKETGTEEPDESDEKSDDGSDSEEERQSLFERLENENTYTDDTAEDNNDNAVFGISGSQWNSMSKDERVKHVRENFIEDYYPEHQIDDRWSYEKVNEVSCVCGNDFIFRESGMCLECGRTYKDAGRTVIKTHEVKDEDE